MKVTQQITKGKIVCILVGRTANLPTLTQSSTLIVIDTGLVNTGVQWHESVMLVLAQNSRPHEASNLTRRAKEARSRMPDLALSHRITSNQHKSLFYNISKPLQTPLVPQFP